MTVRCLRAGPEAVAEAERVVKAGGLVAIPTDTVYGLACDPSSDKAVRRLFEVKNRQANPVPVLCADSGVAERLVDLNAVARRLAKLHWPGALTIVAPLKSGGRLSTLLDQGSGYLGVRVPDNGVCLALAGKVGGAITGTSANLSGEPSCRTAAQVVAALDGKIQLVIDGGALRAKESTVVKVSGKAIEVLREGSVRIQEGELETLNLLVTSQKGSEAKASAEFKEIALQRGHRKLHIEKSGFDGILEIEIENSRDFIAFMRDYVRSEPFRVHFIQRMIPVDVVVDTNLEQIKEAATQIAPEVLPGESFRIDITERDSPTSRKELIDTIAGQVDRKVNLNSPDKVFNVEVLGEYTAMSVVRPDEILSITKLKRSS